MKKTRSDLPLWAKIIFETPELLSEIMIVLKKSITFWRKEIHVRSRHLAWVEDHEDDMIDK